MFFLFQPIKKYLAIRSYRNKLCTYLKQQHGFLVKYIPEQGWRANYTTEQVRSGISALKLSFDWDCYAYAMYCTPDDFNAYHAEIGENCDYTAMYAQVAHSGSSHNDVLLNSDHGNDHGGWFDSGNHHHDGHHHQGGYDGGHHHQGGYDGGHHY